MASLSYTDFVKIGLAGKLPIDFAAKGTKRKIIFTESKNNNKLLK